MTKEPLNRERRRWPRAVTRLLRRNLLWLLAAIGVTSLALGFLGYLLEGHENAIDAAYRSLALIAFDNGRRPTHDPTLVAISRVATPLVAIWATIAAVAALFREQWDVLRCAGRRRHVVVCGLGPAGMQLGKALREQDEPVAAIEEDRSRASIVQARMHGMRVVLGDPTDVDVLRRAGVRRASMLVALSDDDGINAAIVARSRALCAERRRPLPVFAHIASPWLATNLTGATLAENERGLSVEWFSLDDRAARAMLRRHADLERRSRNGTPPHLAIAGQPRLIGPLVVNAARQWLALAGPHADPLRLTVAGRETPELMRHLHARHPRLADVANVEATGQDLRTTGSAAVAAALSSADVVFICDHDDSANLELAFAVQRIARPSTSIVVALAIEGAGFADLLEERRREGVPLQASIRPFGLLEGTLSPRMLAQSLRENVAQAFHEQYLDKARREEPRTGEEPLVPWERLEPRFKESNRAQASAVYDKLRELRCDVRPLDDWTSELVELDEHEIDALAEAEHERWTAEKLADGWRYAPQRDDARKRHDCLVGWDDLPPSVKDYDRVFVQNLPRTLAAAGYEVFRTEPADRGRQRDASSQEPLRA